MKNLPRLLLPVLLALGFAAAQAQTKPKPGYNVMVEISYNEKGEAEDAKVVESEDPTGDHALETVVLNLAVQDHQPVRLVAGKPVKFNARRPFNFPVAGDEGPTAQGSRPTLHGPQPRPLYPEVLAAQGVSGGAIVELIIGADGKVKSVRTLEASHPEFAAAVEAATRQWTFTPNESPGAPADSRWRAGFAFTMNARSAELRWRLAPRPSLGSWVVVRAPLPAPAAPAPVPEAPATGK